MLIDVKILKNIKTYEDFQDFLRTLDFLAAKLISQKTEKFVKLNMQYFRDGTDCYAVHSKFLFLNNR
jgi:hypothetical protein